MRKFYANENAEVNSKSAEIARRGDKNLNIDNCK